MFSFQQFEYFCNNEYHTSLLRDISVTKLLGDYRELRMHLSVEAAGVATPHQLELWSLKLLFPGNTCRPYLRVGVVGGEGGTAREPFPERKTCISIVFTI